MSEINEQAEEEKKQREINEAKEKAAMQLIQDREDKEKAANNPQTPDLNDEIMFPDGEPLENDLQKLSQQVQVEVYKTFLALMRDPNTPHQTKLNAAKELGDRGSGKAIPVGAKEQENKTVDMTLEEAARRMAFIMRDAKERGLDLDFSPEIEEDQDKQT